LALGGCAGQPVDPGPTTDSEVLWREHVLALKGRNSWRAAGRVAVRSSDDGWSAGFRWTQDGQPYEIVISGALGMRRLRLRGDANEVWLRASDGTEVYSPDPASLLRRRLGVALPVLALRYWIIGLPQPGQPHQRELDQHGRLLRLEQGGWQITYQQYEQVQALWLPARLELRRAGIRVKVIVKEIRLMPATLAGAPRQQWIRPEPAFEVSPARSGSGAGS